MGRLNSNEIPPNPFVHGWNAPAARTSAQTIRRPPPHPPVVSPLERTCRIVAQPFPPITRRPPNGFPLGWLTTLFLPAGLILASIIGIISISKTLPSPNSHQPNAATNRSSSPPVASQIHHSTPQTQSSATQATATASSSVSSLASILPPTEPSRVSTEPCAEPRQTGGDSVVLTTPANDPVPIIASLNDPKASLAPEIPGDNRPNLSMPNTQFESPPSPTPSQTARPLMAPRIPEQSTPTIASIISQNPVSRIPDNVYSYPSTLPRPVSKASANVYSYPTAQPTPAKRTPADTYSYPMAQPNPASRAPANVYSYSTAQTTLRAQAPYYYVVISVPSVPPFRSAPVYSYPPVSGHRTDPKPTFAIQSQVRGQGMGRSGRR